jgi:16S rRNA processing protein RimM
MEFEGYYRLGTIIKTHGIKGNVVVKLDVDTPEKYKKTKAVFLLKDGLLCSYKVLSASLNRDLLNVNLEGIPDMNTAETFLKQDVFLPLSDLPVLTGNKIYLHEAVGMTVIDSLQGELGVIQKIYDLPEQPVASVAFGEKELLFPVLTIFINQVDRENKILRVTLPDGLVDIYR